MCTPQVVSVENEFINHEEGYGQNYTYNCEKCTKCECDHWATFNDESNLKNALEANEVVCVHCQEFYATHYCKICAQPVCSHCICCEVEEIKKAA